MSKKTKDHEITSVAFYGIKGSFTYLAAEKFFNRQDSYVSCDRFRGVFDAVASGATEYGVVPVENTLAGSIYENYDLLSEYDLAIVGEVSLRIEHALMAHKTMTSLTADDITQVFSHQKALEQCGVFLRSHEKIKATVHDDTATAAKYVSDNGAGKTWAAIAHPGNAELQGLRIIRNNIEDNNLNFTRFIIVSKQPRRQAVVADKCTLSFYLPHEPGSLSGVFNYFADIHANLTKIESRPLPEKPFEYVFYVDILLPEGYSIDDMLSGIALRTQSYKLLGIYAAAA